MSGGLVEVKKRQASARFINAVTRHIARATDDYATDDECRAKAARIKALKAKYEV